MLGGSLDEADQHPAEMKITSILILKDSETDPVILANAMDLTSFGYFQRGTVKEMMVFVSRTIAKRTPPGRRQSVEHEGELKASLSCPRCRSSEDRGELDRA